MAKPSRAPSQPPERDADLLLGLSAYRVNRPAPTAVSPAGVVSFVDFPTRSARVPRSSPRLQRLAHRWHETRQAAALAGEPPPPAIRTKRTVPIPASATSVTWGPCGGDLPVRPCHRRPRPGPALGRGHSFGPACA